MKILAMIILFISLPNSSAQLFDTLRPNQTLRDNGETLVSAGETFVLGFFSPQISNQNKRFVGIWFKNIPQDTVVWVANRDSPLVTDTSSSSHHFLTITETGNVLILRNDSTTPIWSSNSSAKNPILQLLTSGNLVVRDGNDQEGFAWESFNHPCDTQVAGMKLGWDLETGRSWRLSSWGSPEDPSTGSYTYEIDRRLPQLVQRRGSAIQFRSGLWDGTRFGGDPNIQGNPVFRPVFVSGETRAYYTFENADGSAVTRFWMSPSGEIEHLRWSRGAGEWVPLFNVEKDECDAFGRCGPNGMCHVEDSPVCRCPPGFVPKLAEDWTRLDWTGGCELRKAVSCGGADDVAAVGFRKLTRVKLPYGVEFSVDRTVRNRRECERVCRRNCSCVAFAVAGDIGCVVWFGDLLDMRVYNRGGQNLYVKMVASELGFDDDRKRRAMIISMSVGSGSIIILLLVGLYIIRKRTSHSHFSHENKIINSKNEENQNNIIVVEEDLELPSFGLDIITSATNSFSSTHKIGEGGFGPVYKGVLQNGQEIAVKKLSEDSGQGPTEFKNEVTLMAKLQHRNLVRLLGCCVHKQDRMLIYEYMLNKSLDLYIFNQTRGSALEWQKRFDIMVGIARGLLYLHRDSRLRIIHRDLKASNILLDKEMNPKISDFGLARIFGGEQTEVNTNRVVGTYGYMSPEYAIDGHFSVKSDVFSYGVMVLEIVSGKKNRGFEHPDHDLNLLGHAWKLWNDGRPMDLIDVLMENVPVSEALRCIQVGLLCVQKRPEERPLMSSVLFMLDCENASLPQPKLPGFYAGRSFTETDSSASSGNNPFISTEITVTTFQGR